MRGGPICIAGMYAKIIVFNFISGAIRLRNNELDIEVAQYAG